MRCTYLPVSLHRSNDLSQYWNLNQLSIAYALRLGLGPDLPWADEPSPGNLRFSAGRILTCLIVYLYRHSLFCTLHVSFPSRFSGYRTLLYQLTLVNSASSVHCLSPVTFSAQNPWTSELLRTLLMVAASEPTSWLSERFHILFHLTMILGP